MGDFGALTALLAMLVFSLYRLRAATDLELRIAYSLEGDRQQGLQKIEQPQPVPIVRVNALSLNHPLWDRTLDG